MSADTRPTLATVWLDGCSGCHMSILDMDERLIELAARVRLVSSPYMDLKDLPDHIDLVLVEGAVSSEEDLHKVRRLRARTKLLVSLGDCAVNGNVPSMRNVFRIPELMQRAYQETADEPLFSEPPWPTELVPPLRPRATPVHEVVKVDVFVPGCPPPADAIYHVLTELLEGRAPDVEKWTRFGK
jgi:NAD-reducing hydrogenase small subunit